MTMRRGEIRISHLFKLAKITPLMKVMMEIQWHRSTRNTHNYYR
jgi:hypothetical protein